ncbi:HAD-IA family hydrolase [Amycolatopsis sp. SID8362]|uniref:HAD-IA family hydrolase n=1 Tax=Amycolatopsis sp. SID8362 TaxID=2690346 RepID=UPI00136B02AC|nr:HAD-IA family hydrolase [Amycolatopsis sp. SID8362]NBH06671.1 HAD-IA family hydrolase [Amycolatopsis sp. SID8362]NED43368.1 HAD-IA family hydrolase [Amycolatopsis sp. SID8362]
MSRPDRWEAVVFDVDGTLVDSERDGHRVAFNLAFEAFGLPYRWDVKDYGRWLAVAGGRQRFEAFLVSRGHDRANAAALAARVHAHKTAVMSDLVRAGVVPARSGVPELLAELTELGVRLAVATTGTRAWVEPLLERLFGRSTFELVVTGSEIRALKPDPAVYREVVRSLGVPAEHAVAVEDSRNGLEAAVAAGLSCVVVTNEYTIGHDFPEAAAVYGGFAECRADRTGPLRAGLVRVPGPGR